MLSGYHCSEWSEFLYQKLEFQNFFDVHCVVEASSFSLNHNLALENKQNSVEDP